jgi:hypothetical protein
MFMETAVNLTALKTAVNTGRPVTCPMRTMIVLLALVHLNASMDITR